jgi:hypothetical protein
MVFREREREREREKSECLERQSATDRFGPSLSGCRVAAGKKEPGYRGYSFSRVCRCAKLQEICTHE